MEKTFIQWLAKQPTSIDPDIRIGIGDDAAVISPNSDVVITTDSIAEGTHFRLPVDSLDDVGRKAMAVSLSDLAAMAARPFVAVVNIQAPRSFKITDVQQLYLAMNGCAKEFGLSIVGGDTNSWDGGLVVTTTLLGRPTFDTNGDSRIWRLDSAQPGDTVFVSGDGLGYSLLGSHLYPKPRIELAEYLNQNYGVSAATDASDSLSIDLATMARASQLGFLLAKENIPIRSVGTQFEDDRLPIEHALYDGEDFELIFTLNSTESARLIADRKCPVPVTSVGTMTETQLFLIESSDGIIETLDIKGYEH